MPRRHKRMTEKSRGTSPKLLMIKSKRRGTMRQDRKKQKGTMTSKPALPISCAPLRSLKEKSRG